MLRIFGLTALFMVISTALSYSQTTIQGKVQNQKGEALIAATVAVKGTSQGSITDAEGKFELQLTDPANTVLRVSYIGYISKDVSVSNQTSLIITLENDDESITEVIVVGYGTSTKKELTGAASKVKGDDIQKLNIPRVDQALQGQIAGVNISTNLGSPGGSSSIRIRGLSTFGDNDPLILVDGVVYDSEGLNALNPNDIASINVLKDATAGIYGVRAANGVILIETKQGKKNSKPRFEVSSYYGVQQTSRKLSLLNATEYAILKNEMFANGNDDIPFPNTALGEGTNWQDSVFQSAAMYSLNVGVTGGTAKAQYSIGGSYFTQDGIVGGDKSNFQRLNGRVNLSVDLSDRLKLSSVFLYTQEERDVLPENGIGSVLYNTINAFPTEAIRDADGNFGYLEEVTDIINPIAQMENTYNTSFVNKFVGKEELSYELYPSLSFTGRLNYNFALVDQKVFSPLVYFGPGKAQNTALNADLDPTQVEIASGTFIDRGASVYEERATYSDLNFEAFANYKKTFNIIHHIKSTAGVSVFSRNGKGLGGTAYNIPNNSLEYADISANLAPGGYLNNTNSFQFQERLLSVFLRTEYKYSNKYIFSAILRRDGSSKFGPNNRYGIFPTFSGSWVVSEGYNYDSKLFPFLKLRLSYGISGNDQIANFAYRALLDGEGVYVLNDVIVSGVAIGRASNPDLKWESTRQTNFGIDFSVKRKLNVSFNAFLKNTRGLLFQPDVSALLGSSGAGGFPPVINAGDVSNRGLELEMSYFQRFGDLKLTTSFNATALQNKVISTPDGVDFLPGASFGVGGNIATRFEEGFPIGYFIGFETDGVFQTQEEIDNATVVQNGAKPGDFRYVDQDGDGKINFSDDSDKKMLGSPVPSFTFGYNLSLDYKGFDLSANLFAAVGQEIIRNYERQQPYANQLSYTINRWTGAGSTSENPRLTTDLTRNNVFSDYYVENGSFLRLRNIQLGYRLPLKAGNVSRIESARVYIAANNLWTLTNYQGFDPDIGSFGGPLSAGIDYGFYPQAITTMIGISIQF